MKTPSGETSQVIAFNPVLLPNGETDPIRSENGKTVFQLHAPDVGKITLTFRDKELPLTKNDRGVWEIELPTNDGFDFVQLKIDGVTVLLPYLPIGFGYSRPYNFIDLRQEGRDFSEIRDIPHGSIRHEFFRSSITKEWERMVVYTPPDYDESPKRVYPVLYLQHGHGENEIGWTAMGKINFILDTLIAENKAEPMIVVMNNGMTQEEFSGQSRRVNHVLFEKVLLNDIIPFVEKKFRTIQNRNGRAIAGFSMGSMQAVRIAFTNPDLFVSLGVFSGFLQDWIEGDPVMDMVKREKYDQAHLKALIDPDFAQRFKVLFRSIGTDDPFLPLFAADDKLLQQHQTNHIRKIYTGGHDWNVGRKCIYDFVQLIFKGD